MLDSDDSHNSANRNDEHDHWLAMQSAYAEYGRASAALASTVDSSNGERLWSIRLEGQQRVAFERYLEARMDFLEFRFDESNPLGAGAYARLRVAQDRFPGSATELHPPRCARIARR
jgi:hypothetical protein